MDDWNKLLLKGSRYRPLVEVPSGKIHTDLLIKRRFIFFNAFLMSDTLSRLMNIVPVICATQPKSGQDATSDFATKMEGLID
jgi:hypothetical protein